MRMIDRLVPFVSLLLMSCLSLVSPLRAQPDGGQLERVFKDWEKRRERIQRVRYVVKGQRIIPKGSHTDDMGRPYVPPRPPEDIAQKDDTVLLLDFAGKRFRMERDWQSYSADNRLRSIVRRSIFDSKSLHNDFPREINARVGNVRGPQEPDVSILKNYASHRPLKTVDAYSLSPLLHAHGIVNQFTLASSFVDKPDIDDFHVHGRGVHADRACLVLRTFPAPSGTASCFDEYWVDPARDSAILRHAQYFNGKLRTNKDVTYQQTSHGWLPLSWVGTTRDLNGRRLINVARLRVEEFTIEPAVTDTNFQVEIKPGMIINEDDYAASASEKNRLGYQRKLYRVSAGGSWEEIGSRGEPLPNRARWGWLGLLAVPVVAALAYLWWRRRNRRGKIGPAPAVS